MFETIPFHCSAHPLPCAMIFWFVLLLIYFQSKANNHSRPFTAFWEDFHISNGSSTNSIAEQTTCQIAFPNGHKFWTHILSQQCESFFTQPWRWPLGCGKLKPEKAIWGESCWVCLSVRTETHTQTRKYSYVVLREPTILKKISASQRPFWLVGSVWSVTHARCISIRQASIGMPHHSVSGHSVNHSNHTGYTKWPKSNDLIKELVHI